MLWNVAWLKPSKGKWWQYISTKNENNFNKEADIKTNVYLIVFFNFFGDGFPRSSYFSNIIGIPRHETRDLCDQRHELLPGHHELTDFRDLTFYSYDEILLLSEEDCEISNGARGFLL